MCAACEARARELLEERRELLQLVPRRAREVALGEHLGHLTQDMQARYRELATERVEQRIGRTLLRLAAQSGQEASGGIELALTRQDLAEMAGTTLHTVSRVLAEWDRKGIIDSRREHLRITDPHGLVRVADGLP